MPTEITVRGTFSTFQAPERATVHATIAFEGPAMEPVYDRVARDLETTVLVKKPEEVDPPDDPDEEDPDEVLVEGRVARALEAASWRARSSAKRRASASLRFRSSSSSLRTRSRSALYSSLLSSSTCIATWFALSSSSTCAVWSRRV